MVVIPKRRRQRRAPRRRQAAPDVTAPADSGALAPSGQPDATGGQEQGRSGRQGAGVADEPSKTGGSEIDGFPVIEDAHTHRRQRR